MPRRHARRGDEREGRDGLVPRRRVTAVVGTHTHVPTADARVLPGGTAYITDVGMTGPRGGVIGVKKEQSSSRCGPICRCASRPPTTTPGSTGSSSAPPAAARRRDRAGARAVDTEQRDHQRAEEPDDVEVEPVGDAELQGDQHGGGERGEARRGRAGAARTRARSRAAPRRPARPPAPWSSRAGPRCENGEPRSAWKPSVRS